MSETPINSGLTMVPEDVLPSAWVGHIPFAFWLIEEARPDLLVELGTHNGTSFLAFCQAIKARGTGTKAYAVDTWEGDEHAGHYGAEVHDRLESVVKAKYAGFAQLMRMLFDEAMPYFSDGSVDLLHIDGLHTHNAVKHDFQSWLPKMSRRGVIVFHDTMVREREFGVWQLWEELRARYPSFEFKHTHGLGVLLVGDQPPASLLALCALTGTPAEAITSNLFDALGQRFSLLDKISQLDARNAVAVQHAANYQTMYENADRSLHQAMDNFTAQLEVRRKEVEATSATIAGFSATLEALQVEFRTRLAIARLELGLAPSPADAAEPPQALAGLVEELKVARAKGIAEGIAHRVAAEAERARLEQALAIAGGELQVAQAGLEEQHSRHAAELARSGSEFESERSALLRDRDGVKAELAAARLRMDQLQARHAGELAAANARFYQERSTARTGFESELALTRALSQSELELARAEFETERASAGAAFERDMASARAALAAHQAGKARLRSDLRESVAQAQDLRSRVARREDEIQRLVGSHSWRVTAPIRWLRARWTALRRGTAAPTYAEMLGLTVGGNPAVSIVDSPPASAMPPEAADVEARKQPTAGLAPAAPEEAFDADFYLLQYPDSAAENFDQDGDARAQDAANPSHEGFDAFFYLMQYPDVASAGMDPYEHYISNGKAEGRYPARPRLVISEGGIAFDPARETVLVVAHEASRTGAPVLSLNLVTSLNRRYNVIAMLLGEGPLIENFRNACTWLAGPTDIRGSQARGTEIIDQLMTLHRPRFAVANSIESRVVLEPLSRHGVVTVSLVHEFAVYSRPRNDFRSALLWADESVFSTALTRESAHTEFPELSDRNFTVLPQGRCYLPAGEYDEAEAGREDTRLLAALRPRGEADDAFVVLGAGFVQQRKGVDLFIQCAALVVASERGRNCRFVWIGSGYDPERDLGYSVYLADQLRRSGLDKVVQIIHETSRIETAYEAADLLLLSSRLDPLPNVAIDAMAHGLPVVCFDRSSGIASVLVEEGLQDALVAGYLDVHDLAGKVLELAASPPLREQISQRVLDVVDRRFSMEDYVSSLEKLALDAEVRLAQRAQEVDEVVQSGLFQADFHASRTGPNAPVEAIVEFEYLRCRDYGNLSRKPFPGFHPGVYRSMNCLAPSADPLLHFLRSGRPAGPWLVDVISPMDARVPHDPRARIALHLHVYYPEMLPDMLARLTENVMRPDLYISLPNDAAKAIVEPMLAAYDGRVARVQVVPNRGRDIAPFLTVFGDAWSAYDAVGHLHTKKSLELNDAALSLRWNAFLMDNLLGRGHRMADAVVGRLLADPGLGLVFPDDPHVMGWCDNRAHAELLGNRLGIADLPAEFNFPVGTMFWARPAAIQALVDLGLKWEDYPEEPLGYDGTLLHAIERLVPTVAAASGFTHAVTNVPGVTR